MKFTTLMFATALMATGNVLAQTTVVSFSTLSQAGTGFRQIGNTVTQSGFTFVSSGGSFGNILGVWQNGSANHPSGGVSSTSLAEFFAGSTTSMTASDSSPFQLNAIDLASWAVGQSGTMTITFNGIRIDGSTVSQSFSVPNSGASTPALQHFAFGATFSNLASVRFTQGTNSVGTAFQFNNISVSPVPEPSAAWLLGSSFLLLLSVSRVRPRLLARE
jgi:hypothetical protein